MELLARIKKILAKDVAPYSERKEPSQTAAPPTDKIA
jgi:hypothetical protein